MKPASTLEEAVYLFDPLRPLSEPEELASFYVDRGSEVRSHFSLMLKSSDLRQQRPIKLLFTGHKGSGKSTEMNKLCQELDDEFFVVKVQTGQRPDVNYIDVLLKAAMALLKVANDNEIIKRALAQSAADVWARVFEFVKEGIYGSVDLPTGDSRKELTAKISFFGLEFESKYDTEPDTREKMRRISEDQISEIIKNIDLMSDRIRADSGKPVLLIFEETDRLDLAVAEELFYKRAETLTRFNASAIFLLDIGLRYSDRFNSLKQHYRYCKVLPNIKTKKRDGEPYPPGADALKELVLNRLDAALISEEALQLVIEKSGGVARMLIALMLDASLTALTRGAQQIELPDVEHAINSLRGDFVALLASTDYVVLRARHSDKNLNNDGEIQKLLEKLALLEYANDDTWCDVHPILLPEVERRAQQVSPIVEPVIRPAEMVKING